MCGIAVYLSPVILITSLYVMFVNFLTSEDLAMGFWFLESTSLTDG